MRCNNCGWDNPGGIERCEKCNAPLKGSMVMHMNDVSNVQNDNLISETIKGSDPNLPYLDMPVVEEKEGKQQLSQNLKACPQCGYPVRSDVVKCPNCGKILEKSRGENKQPEQKKNISGTISPWDKPKYSKCFLKPIAREGEKEFQEIEFSGDEIELNRDNLEKDNMTITRKVQAVLKNIDGKWYIVDKSSLQTTFKLISEPVELKNGDIILMGDRKFEFIV